jgi:Uma2 family endonuclease
MIGDDGSVEEVPPMSAGLVELDQVVSPEPWRDWTFEDLLRTPDDGRRHEIIDGSLHVSPGPTASHQIAATRLISLLAAAAPEPYEAVGPVNVVCGRSVLQPDIVVLRYDHDTAHGLEVNPADMLLAGEVVSPSSRRMDRLVKPSVLAEAGIPGYWRVELDGSGVPLIVVYELVGGSYREVVTVRAGEVVTVDVPYPVELRPAELVGPRRKG